MNNTQPQPIINYSIFPAPNVPGQPQQQYRRRRKNRNKKKKNDKKPQPWREYFMWSIFLAPITGQFMNWFYGFMGMSSANMQYYYIEWLKSVVQ